MKKLEDMHTAEEVEAAYYAAIRNFPAGTNSAIAADPMPCVDDGPTLAHAKAAYRRWQELLGTERRAVRCMH